VSYGMVTGGMPGAQPLNLNLGCLGEVPITFYSVSSSGEYPTRFVNSLCQMIVSVYNIVNGVSFNMGK
jgi:hypothetical protein